MERYAIIQKKVWRNKYTKQTASFFGAYPGENWLLVVDDNYLVHDTKENRYYGNPYKPFRWSKDEAQVIVDRKNEMSLCVA